jgi:cytochrome c oxidase subunit 2
MQKWIMFAFFIAASVMGLYLLTFGLPEKPKDPAAGLAEGVTLMQVDATNYEFDQKEYKVKVGDKVHMKLMNKSGVHAFGVEALGINLTQEEPEMDYTFAEAGTFEIHCSQPCGIGHSEMKATLIVEA